jgi:hypothetical protein
VRVEVRQLLPFDPRCSELGIGLLQLADLLLEGRDWWWVASEEPGPDLEVFAQVAVFVGQQPALDPGLGGQLDDGEFAGGAKRGALQQPVGGGLDGGPVGVCGVGRGVTGRVRSCSPTIEVSRASS